MWSVTIVEPAILAGEWRSWCHNATDGTKEPASNSTAAAAARKPSPTDGSYGRRVRDHTSGPPGHREPRPSVTDHQEAPPAALQARLQLLQTGLDRSQVRPRYIYHILTILGNGRMRWCLGNYRYIRAYTTRITRCNPQFHFLEIF